MPPPAASQPSLRSAYIPQLDGLRFLAFLMILVHHSHASPESGFWQVVRQYGWVGVEVFFVLSAFLLSVRLGNERERMGTINWHAFYMRRIWRICPLYFFYLALMLFWTGNSITSNPEIALRYWGLLGFFDNVLCMLRGYNPIDHSIHLWTISYEIQCYLALPWLYLLMARLDMRRRLLFCGAITLMAMGLRYGALSTGQQHPFIYVCPFLRPESILAGILLACAVREGVKLRTVMYMTALAIAVIVPTMIATQQTVSRYGPWQIYLYTVTGAMAMVTLYSVLQPGTAWFRLLGWRPLAYLGEISYGLYIYHKPCLWLAADLLKGAGYFSWDTQVLLALAMTIPAAVCSYHLLEKPLLKRKPYRAI